jgi:tetratricopeptide (TPR) repeat protein
MEQATSQAPNQPLLWVTRGDSQMGIADAAAKAAREGNRASNTPAIQQKYRDAVASYKRAIDLNAASSRPNPEITASASNQMGSAAGKSGDLAAAGVAFEAAVQANPANAALYYFNEAVIFYNGAKIDEAVLAAEKAIAANPNKAEAYYIKGQALVQKATVDPKTFSVIAPAGCVEAYRQYLALAPDGTYAAQVKEILAGIGTTVKSTYSAKKSKKS